MAENPILNDRYRLIEQIGAGGMAVIYRGQDLELERQVAIKVLRPSLVGDPEFLARFKREARSAAKLAHPNIVMVHDVGQDGPSTHYIVMEYIRGQNLKQILRAQGALDVDGALAVAIESCKGVGYAHRAELVHCDIKPQNILMTPDKMIKVADFGIARALSGGKAEKEELVWGSPHYFSPEQAAGESPTPASDVYSIGIVLFELLTGRLPFTGSNYHELAMAHLQQTPPSILDIDPSLPVELDRIIRKVMDKEPSNRYRTGDQLGRILKSYRDQGLHQTSSFEVQESMSKMPPVQVDSTPSSPPSQDAHAGDRTQPHMDDPYEAGYGYEQPPQREEPAPASSSDFTLPGLPATDPAEALYRARGRNSAYAQPGYPEGATAPGYDTAPPEEEGLLPGVDIENIVLGVLAAIAVLGLVPLWVFVFITFTR